MARREKKQQTGLEEESIGSKILSVFFVFLIIVIWLLIIIGLIKFDVGGFGSNVLPCL